MHYTRHTRHTALAAAILTSGALIALRPGGVWWILLLAGAAWAQAWLLSRSIPTSGLPTRAYRATSWALLAIAVASLLAGPARLALAGAALLGAVASVVGARLRQAR